MGFEKFDDSGRGRGRPAGADPMVSLRKSGSIGLNAATLETYFDGTEGAVMYYNDEDNQIGIEPVPDSEADDAAYTVSSTGSGATIAPRAFLEDYDLIPDVTTQYDPEWDDDRNLVVVDLEHPTGTYGDSD